MATARDKTYKNFQQFFHARWGCLSDPHVRSLAWLLDAPDLLAPDAPQWQGKIGSLKLEPGSLRAWLTKLDSNPQELHAWITLHPLPRLGRYAEKLMSFYFAQQGSLIAHGVQLRGPNQETLGEFDFLLSVDGKILHLELATKFYLMQTRGALSDPSHAMDYFIGPNLADTLGLKIRKIIDKQLALAKHPAAQVQLSHRIDMSQALIKGWLFYHENDLSGIGTLDLSIDHCRGFWCTVSEFERRLEQAYLILPRLSWLAPAKWSVDLMIDKRSLLGTLNAKFQHESMPVLVAIVEPQMDAAIEIERGFIVPDDWQTRAGQRQVHAQA